tara:strand:- start:5154 stop:6068 length:915 start_codon:yes stop_codon:yes gene_type:complete
MQTPPYLTKGSHLRIISTARKISKEELQPAIDRLESWGLNLSFGKNLFSTYNQFAGTTEQRVQDLQDALDDPNVEAILCARGGYGTVQLIDQIDFSAFKKNLKWLVGYSDVTVLHCHINQTQEVESLHATMPINFAPFSEKDEAAESLRKALFGEKLEYQFTAEEESILNFTELNAPIFGGNLSILYSLSASVSQLKKDNFFLFFEDLDEYLYHIDRMMMNLKRSGIFTACKGVLVGGMSDMNDNTIPYGKSAKAIIQENLKDFEIPVIFGVPAGHIKQNLALILGRTLQLSREGSRIKLTFHG